MGPSRNAFFPQICFCPLYPNGTYHPEHSSKSFLPPYPQKRRRASSVDAESGRSAPVEASIAIVSQLLDSSSISPSRSTTPKRRQLDDNLPHKSLNIPLSTLYRNYVKPAKPYWFDDGDYILIVSDHFFKVPFRMLSCSDIFADMFALAQPQATELLDGCPVIQLTDRPQDWMVSLQWMDNPL